MEFLVLKYRVSILGVIPVCHTKTILWTNLLRSPWWKETHVLKGLKNGGWVVYTVHQGVMPCCFPELQVVEVKLPGTSWPEAWTSVVICSWWGPEAWTSSPFGVSPGEDAHLFAHLWRLYWLWSVNDFVLFYVIGVYCILYIGQWCIIWLTCIM